MTRSEETTQVLNNIIEQCNKGEVHERDSIKTTMLCDIAKSLSVIADELAGIKTELKRSKKMIDEEMIQENIECNNFEISEDEIICPYCGYKESVTIEMYFGDDYVDEYREGEKKLTCPKCKHKFLLSKSLKWEYTTEII